MEKHKGKLRITFDVLKTALGLPPEARIVSIECTGRDIGIEQFYVYVEHPDLPRWKECEDVCLILLADIEDNK